MSLSPIKNACLSIVVAMLCASAFTAAPRLAGAQQVQCSAQISAPETWLDPAHRLALLNLQANGAQDLMRDGADCRQTAGNHIQRFLKIRPYSLGLRVVYNSRIPDPRGDGALWAGRGASALIRAGFLFDYGIFHATVAPELMYEQNRPTDILAPRNAARSSFAAPFYSSGISIDMPTRMGADAITQIAPGQTALWADYHGVSIGWSASNSSWGPGLDGLMLGNSSAGVPRAFIRTSRPVATPIGKWSASYFLGRVTESRFFDFDSLNNSRTLSAVAIGWTPASTNALALGLSRAVMRVIPRGTIGTRNLGSAFAPLNPADGDELVAFSARLHLPAARTRAWIELGHQGPLRLRDILTSPGAGTAYRVGLERGIEYTGGAWVFLFEAANLEMPQDFTDRQSHDFYSGWGTSQGWTQRGQLLGSGTGPGSQSQYLSADWVAADWSAGGFLERVRWNEDAMFREYLPYPNRHDVSVRVGARGSVTRGGFRTQADLSVGTRLDYLFQNADYIPDYRTVDVPLLQLKFTVTPGIRTTP